MVPVQDFTRIQELRESSLGRFTEEEMTPQQVITPAGSVVIRDIRMWHRGTPNRDLDRAASWLKAPTLARHPQPFLRLARPKVKKRRRCAF